MTLPILLAKDLHRARRNPLPWLINLIIPLAITALLGLVFGGGDNSNALGRIHFAVVDEDKSALSGFLRGAANQGQAGDHLQAEFLDRAAALKRINENTISAVLIIPTNFMRNYLTARTAVSLELIKNPAESIHPAVLEELLGVVVTGLNAISRNFNSQFPEWQAVFEGKQDYHKVSELIDRAGDKFKMAKQFIDPPLVGYEKGEPSSNSESSGLAGAAGGSGKTDAGNSVFAYVLIGLSAMFLLFLGQNAMSDLHRELRYGTFRRYQTLHDSLTPFIAGKAVFTVTMLLVCGIIMLGGGGLIFRISWKQPAVLAAMVLGYACCVAGFFAVLVALVPDERRANVMNNLTAMALGLAGGCAFPPQQLPTFLRDYVTPHLPTYWFVNTIRDLQYGDGHAEWGLALIKLIALSLGLIALAALLFGRRSKSGWHA